VGEQWAGGGVAADSAEVCGPILRVRLITGAYVYTRFAITPGEGGPVGLGLGFGVGFEVSTIKEVHWPDGRPWGVVLTVLQLLCSKVQNKH
jgi:hypothetical protein